MLTSGVPKLSHDDEDENEMEDAEDPDDRVPSRSTRRSR